MKGNYKTLIHYLKKGGFALLGNGSNVRTLVSDLDLARAALACLENRQSHGQIYNVTDGDIHSFDEIVYSMCRTLGRKPPFLKISDAKVIHILHGLNRIFRFPWLARLSRMVEKQVESLDVSGDKLQTDLGFTPEVAFRDYFFLDIF
jgi:UDP-glucose 4-epimerase